MGVVNSYALAIVEGVNPSLTIISLSDEVGGASVDDPPLEDLCLAHVIVYLSALNTQSIKKKKVNIYLCKMYLLYLYCTWTCLSRQHMGNGSTCDMS